MVICIFFDTKPLILCLNMQAVFSAFYLLLWASFHQAMQCLIVRCCELEEIQVVNFCITLKFDRCLSNHSAEEPDKFQHDKIILTPNLASSRLKKAYDEVSYPLVTQGRPWGALMWTSVNICFFTILHNRLWMGLILTRDNDTFAIP